MVYVSGSWVRFESLPSTLRAVVPVALTTILSSAVTGGSSPPEDGPLLQLLNAPVAPTITSAHNTARHESFIPPPALRFDVPAARSRGGRQFNAVFTANGL